MARLMNCLPTALVLSNCGIGVRALVVNTIRASLKPNVLPPTIVAVPLAQPTGA